MCGICGFYGFEDENAIKRMVKSLSHRGPDASGTYTDGNISFGHTRLSIIDTSDKGKQPMSNENGTVWITYNGETYNFMDLKKNLKRRHDFYSNTDTEVLIHAYEDFGIDFVKKLRGMFAFAMYDSVKKKLILARDPIGKKPLYYYWDGNKFIFASEIKAILEAGIKREIDIQGLCAYLTHQYTIGRNTMFLGIRKVLGGEVLTLDINSKKLKVDKYFDIKEDIVDAPEEFFVQKLRALLEESAQLRTIADTPVGAFLSGGIDSTSVVALTKPKIDYDLHTFSMGFVEGKISELEYAKMAAEHIGTVHHEVKIGARDVIKELEKIAWHYDEPIGEAAVIANYFLAKEARKYVKVVVAGEAGDELFGGYRHYKIWKTYPWFSLPPIFRSKLKNIVSSYLKKECFFKNKFPYYVIPYYLNVLSQKDLYHASLDLTKAAMADEELKWFTSERMSFDKDLIVFPVDMKDPLNKMLALDCKNMLPEKYLMKADKATMANAVEERLPLMDKDVVEFSFKIPPKFKIKNGDGKHILKMAVKDLVPEKIIKRKKTGFGVPYTHWVKDEMRELVEQKLDEGELINKLFEKEKVKMLIENSQRNEWCRNTDLVWNLFALELWYEQFFHDT